jgi:hypothetical protein
MQLVISQASSLPIMLAVLLAIAPLILVEVLRLPECRAALLSLDLLGVRQAVRAFVFELPLTQVRPSRVFSRAEQPFFVVRLFRPTL